jgi:hypothetical protein
MFITNANIKTVMTKRVNPKTILALVSNTFSSCTVGRNLSRILLTAIRTFGPKRKASAINKPIALQIMLIFLRKINHPVSVISRLLLIRIYHLIILESNTGPSLQAA